jgi:uncharacterized protein
MHILRRPVAAAVPLLLVLAACARPANDPRMPDPSLATVEVATVAVDPRTQTPVVLLQDPETERIVPIWIGLPEAEAIARSLEGVSVPRPMTHDLLASVIAGLGGRVVEVVILEQRGGTYYGSVRLIRSGGNERVDLDARPSDAMALALRTGAPIRVARELLLDSLEDATPPPPAPTV